MQQTRSAATVTVWRLRSRPWRKTRDRTRGGCASDTKGPAASAVGRCPPKWRLFTNAPRRLSVAAHTTTLSSRPQCAAPSRQPHPWRRWRRARPERLRAASSSDALSGAKNGSERRMPTGRAHSYTHRRPSVDQGLGRRRLGEERLGHRLNELVTDQLRVLYDRRVPSSRANIDHLAVTPTGVYVIDAKKYRGRPHLKVEGGLLRPRVEKLLVGPTIAPTWWMASSSR